MKYLYYFLFTTLFLENIYANNIVIGSSINSWRQGKIKSTKVYTDLAINGRGFFILQNSKKETLYSRKISLRLLENGDVVDYKTGFQVLTGKSQNNLEVLNLQSNDSESIVSLGISDEGQINAFHSNGKLKNLNNIALAMFHNQRQLKLIKDDMLKPTKRSGAITINFPTQKGFGLIMPRSSEATDLRYYQNNLDTFNK